jgi:tetratricopeptide (TPR) repeat protein
MIAYLLAAPDGVAQAQLLPHAPLAGRAIVHPQRVAPQANPPQQAPGNPPAGVHSSPHHGGHHHPLPFNQPYYPYGGVGAWTAASPYLYAWYGFPYYGPVWNGNALPAVVPAPLVLNGPQAVNGVAGGNAPAAPALNLPVRGAANGGAANAGAANGGEAKRRQRPGIGGFGVLAEDGKDAKPKAGRVSNAESLARARQFIAFGDQHFQAQEYSEAYQRYKKAAIAAPDLADVYFRQAFALLALGRYAQAAKTLRRGLGLDAEWPQSAFRLDELYGDNRLAKLALLERLATEASDAPDDADLMFLLGVTLYFDGQAERSRLFFRRAVQLGADRGAIIGFLNVAPAAGNAAGRQEL